MLSIKCAAFDEMKKMNVCNSVIVNVQINLLLLILFTYGVLKLYVQCSLFIIITINVEEELLFGGAYS